jgi:hypothetical protein
VALGLALGAAAGFAGTDEGTKTRSEIASDTGAAMLERMTLMPKTVALRGVDRRLEGAAYRG